MKIAVLCASLAATVVAAFSQQHIQHTNTFVTVPGSEPRERNIDVLKMRVDVRFEPEIGKVKGKVTHVFKPLRNTVDSIVFDAIKINVTQALLSGKPVRTRSTDTTLVVYCEPSIHWDVVDSLQFIYDVTPRKGIYFIGWNDRTNRMRKQIWTQGQGIDNRAWIPMYDEMNDKYITETIITFDSTYQVLSNGTRLGVKDAGQGQKTWHYTMTHPHAPYLLMLAIGKYDITDRQTLSGVPIHLYSYPDRKDQIESSYRYSAESIDFMEKELDVPYPWESYSQVPVADFIFGAMENTTATIFGDFYLSDARSFLDRNYFATNVHELTHQWFGDFITARSSKHLWLQESFATFYPHLYTRTVFGEDAYQWSRRGQQNSAITAGESDRLPIVHPSSGTTRIYPKGAAVIDMMRYAFGEEQVRRVITHYLRKHAYSNVETNDLYQSFQDTLGITPDWFFKQWLYQGGEPHYKVSYSTVPGATNITVNQIHIVDNLTGYFRMPIHCEVYYKGGGKDTVREWVDGPTTNIRVVNKDNKAIAFVTFDPGSHVMKKVTFEKSYAELAEQVRHASNMIDRYDALVALKSDTSRTADKLALLEAVYNAETFPSMRAEVVNQLSNLKGEQVRALTIKALGDKSLEVRQAALNIIHSPDASWKSHIEVLLSDSSYAMVANVLGKLCAWYPGSCSEYVGRTSNERGAFERVRIANLENAILGGDTSKLSELIDLSSDAWEFRTRQNAFDALKRLNHLESKSVRNLLEAVTSPNERLAGAAKSSLDSFRVQTRYAALIQTEILKMEQQLQGWRLERLRSLKN